MLKLAVIGKDVHESQSPKMHTFILNRLGADCSYEAVSIPPEQFEERVEGLFSRYDAFNVTIPFKGDIIPHLKGLRGDAPAFGAVNTVLTAQREGYNTDGFGFLLLLENGNVPVKGRKVLILGTGGVGRSCIKKLLDAGAEVYAYERDRDRLATVAAEFAGFTPLDVVENVPYDVIINCTGIGMHNTVGMTPSVRRPDGSEGQVGEELLSLCTDVVDLIYVPAQSEFLRVGASLGKHTVNGESMLFYQAYYADCIYLGKTPSAAEAKALYQQYTGGKQ